MLRTVISVDNSVYLHWQTQLLVETFQHVRQPGTLTRLVATRPGETVRPIDGIETVITRAYSPDPMTGDDYAPYNKPGSLAEWLATDPGDDNELILLIDADFIFLDQAVFETERGQALSEPIGYMRRDWAGVEAILQRHCRVSFDKVPAVGVPNVLRRADLRLIAPRWYELTRETRANPQTRDEAGWICEMWGYSLACAELGLENQERRMCHFENDPFIQFPLLHYCYRCESADKSWTWSKRSYTAWTPLEPIPADTAPTTQRLHAHLHAMTIKHGFQPVT